MQEKNSFEDDTPIPFLVDKEEEDKEETAAFPGSPYNFRAEYKEKIVVPKTEDLDENFSSIRFHAIGIGILIGILATVLISVVLWGISDEKEIEPIIITASDEPVKEKPENPGGMRIPDQDKLVYKRLRTDDKDIKVENVIPVPEAPVKPVVENIVKPTVKPEASEMELEVISLKNKGMTIEAPKAVEPPKQVVSQVAPPQVEQPKTPVPEKQPLKEEAPQTTGLNADTWHVQLISLPSKESAEKNWPKILKDHSILLSGQPHDIVEVSIPEKGTFYRLRVGEFKTRDEAKALCDKLKSRKQDCTVTK